MSASSSHLLVGMGAGMAIEQFPFRPVLDGYEGIVSDRPVNRLARGASKRVLFMARAVLDEGLPLLLNWLTLIAKQGQSFCHRTFRPRTSPLG